MVKRRIEKKLLRYRDLLEAEGIHVARMVLFGSHARGHAREGSDIDVCVVSRQLGRDRIAEGKRLFLLAMRIDPLIEPVAFSTHQYRHDRLSPLLDQIRKHGVTIM